MGVQSLHHYSNCLLYPKEYQKMSESFMAGVKDEIFVCSQHVVGKVVGIFSYGLCYEITNLTE